MGKMKIGTQNYQKRVSGIVCKSCRDKSKCDQCGFHSIMTNDK